MKVTLLNHTPLTVADAAIGKCYDKGCYTDFEKIQNRINNVANVKKHASTIEHLSYNFDIDGVSRALLQELARHRIASYSVKSTRYTLKELRDEKPFNSDYTYFDSTIACERKEIDEYSIKRASKYIVLTDDINVDTASVRALEELRGCIANDIKNDKAKYCMPEAYKTSLVMTINARSLQNFISLRSSKHALWEIQDLAKAMFDAVPEDHKFLFEKSLKVC